MNQDPTASNGARANAWAALRRWLQPIRAGLLAFTGLALGGCDDRDINYRLMVSVEADGAVHTGSGVIATTWQDQRLGAGLAGGISWYPKVHGQAIPVDLGQKRSLFVLLRGDGVHKYSNPDLASLLAGAVTENKRPAGMPIEQALTLTAGHKGVVNVPCDALPMMVRFDDVADPNTVEQVDPCDLAKSFGPDVRLARATIAVTDERPTTGIETWLPWLTTVGGGYLSGEHSFSDPRLAGALSRADFSR